MSKEQRTEGVKFLFRERTKSRYKITHTTLLDRRNRYVVVLKSKSLEEALRKFKRKFCYNKVIAIEKI